MRRQSSVYKIGFRISFHFIFGIFDKCPITAFWIEMWSAITPITIYRLVYGIVVRERQRRRRKRSISARVTTGSCRLEPGLVTVLLLTLI